MDARRSVPVLDCWTRWNYTRLEGSVRGRDLSFPTHADENSTLMEKQLEHQPEEGSSSSSRARAMVVAVCMLLSVILLLLSSSKNTENRPLNRCENTERGYQGYPEISHYWGPYAPFFSLDAISEISADIPAGCNVTFVQVLSRHGARYPTLHKSTSYSDLIDRIQQHATAFRGDFAFLEDYRYTLGADNLTAFGENEMALSGVTFYNRYKSLTRSIVPFARSSGSDRVVRSGELFLNGFQNAKAADPQSKKNDTVPTIKAILPEEGSFNNTLSHNNCPALEDSDLSDSAKMGFLGGFAPAILDRIEHNLPGVNLSIKDALYLMDLCPFETVAKTIDASELSPFCSLFTQEEWRHYDYYQSLGKYYGYGAGNSLGPAQGIGFVNELIARMSNTPVNDHTNVNHTLDSDPESFPLDATLYVDFSHDNSMTSIYAALGLYNGTKQLSRSRIQSTNETDGYSAAWTVPFGARAYIEMMQCPSGDEPLVRVLVNDRVVPLHGCEVDELGRCSRGDFIEGLEFARTGGNWESCYLAT
ncbi:hypothetical protein DTO271D3_4272 [Paecilomyces variotii]|nr:hypothetical protein DTO169C6_5392 [Paecilomyces variotii]KAJ9315395.1 hypothetical protein DTO271D3_4272 [Paecilomyces variotii]